MYDSLYANTQTLNTSYRIKQALLLLAAEPAREPGVGLLTGGASVLDSTAVLFGDARVSLEVWVPDSEVTSTCVPTSTMVTSGCVGAAGRTSAEDNVAAEEVPTSGCA